MDKNFIEDPAELIRSRVEDKKVLLALYGSVDSSVVAAMLTKAIGQQLVCVHVNHSLMRKNKSERFLGKLENVTDSEQKRKIIGGKFIRVFEEGTRKL